MNNFAMLYGWVMFAALGVVVGFVVGYTACDWRRARGVRVDAKPVAWLDSFGEPHRRREDAWDGDPESAEPRPLYEHPPTAGVKDGS